MTKMAPQDQGGQTSSTRLLHLSDRDMADAKRLLRLLEGSGPSTSARHVTREMMIEAARAELKERRRRTVLFPDGLFGEPAWEILLLLYIEQKGMRLTLARVSTCVDVAPTTVLRWMSFLQDRKLIVRHAHPTDQRSVLVELSEKGLEALDRYFAEKLSQSA